MVCVRDRGKFGVFFGVVELNFLYILVFLYVIVRGILVVVIFVGG